MPSFADSIFLFVLALLLFGPKRLPVLARELGKWMGEFRRASNEFKMQMEEELRLSEQAERQKQIAAMEAAAPVPPPLNEPAEPEHPHLRYNAVSPEAEPDTPAPGLSPVSELSGSPQPDAPAGAGSLGSSPDGVDAREAASHVPAAPEPLPIATSGSLKMMPPATGLPVARSSRPNSNPLSGLVDSIPEAASSPVAEPESMAHGD